MTLASLLDEANFGEPTTGLHGMDVTRLLTVINGFVERGVIVLMVEHNLDAMLAADWIIDLGPDAGSRGGKVMYAARHPGVLMLRILLRERNFDVTSKWMSPNAAQSDFMR